MSSSLLPLALLLALLSTAHGHPQWQPAPEQASAPDAPTGESPQASRPWSTLPMPMQRQPSRPWQTLPMPLPQGDGAQPQPWTTLPMALPQDSGRQPSNTGSQQPWTTLPMGLGQGPKPWTTLPMPLPRGPQPWSSTPGQWGAPGTPQAKQPMVGEEVPRYGSIGNNLRHIRHVEVLPQGGGVAPMVQSAMPTQGNWNPGQFSQSLPNMVAEPRAPSRMGGMSLPQPWTQSYTPLGGRCFNKCRNRCPQRQPLQYQPWRPAPTPCNRKPMCQSRCNIQPRCPLRQPSWNQGATKMCGMAAPLTPYTPYTPYSPYANSGLGYTSSPSSGCTSGSCTAAGLHPYNPLPAALPDNAGEGTMLCGDGAMISLSKKCDGVADCGKHDGGPGGEDEEECSGDGAGSEE